MTDNEMNIQQVSAMVNMTPAGIYKRIKAGNFPQGTKKGYFRRWNLAEIRAWLDTKKEGSYE